MSIDDNLLIIGSSLKIGDPSNRLGSNGLVIRIVGVGREGVVVADDNVGEGLSGSLSSRFLGRRVDRNIFFRPARERRLDDDLGGDFGIAESETGDWGTYCEREVGGAGKISGGSL